MADVLGFAVLLAGVCALAVALVKRFTKLK